MSLPLEDVAVAVPFAARNLRVVLTAPGPRYSRGVAKEGGQLLPGRRPGKALAGAVVEKCVDAPDFRPANSSEG